MLCDTHYQRWLKGSRSSSQPPPPRRQPCPTPDCPNDTIRGCCYSCADARSPRQRLRTLDERIEYHTFKPEGEDGHWLWNGRVVNGYPVVMYKSKTYYVRRVLYVQRFPLKGKLVRSECGVSNCVNPLHAYS
jgi:hypothetical protein